MTTTSSASAPLRIAPFKVTWTHNGSTFVEETTADGRVTTPDHVEGAFDGNAYTVHGNKELILAADGSVTSSSGGDFGSFKADDVFAFSHVANRQLRLLADGTVVAEDADGNNRAPLGAKVDPVTPGTSRAALLEVLHFANLAPDLRAIVKGKK